MAGTLPGVETARRRRFHGTSTGLSDSPGGGSASFRRSSFGHSSTTAPSLQRSMVRQSYPDERLGGVAREAKERLDERLRAPWKSQSKRFNSGVTPRVGEARKVVVGDFRTEVFGLKRSGSGSKRFSWAKMSWKALDQDECAVCLEHFKVGETLAHLPCAHRFHARCLVPWLENNAHCPCCRAPNSSAMEWSKLIIN